MLSKLKMGKKIIIWGLLSLSFIFTAAPVSAYMADWGLDIDGSGGDYGITTIAEYLDLTGFTTIYEDNTNDTFTETGMFYVNSYDTDGFFDTTGAALTAEFFTSGSMLTDEDFVFDETEGALIISSYLSDEIIGVFDLVSGEGSFEDNNGWISIDFVASELAEGYWFDSDGNDLSAWTLEEDSFVLTFAITTVNASLSDDSVEGVLTVSNNGQFRLDAVVVPEPATMLLFGAGLLCIAGGIRKERIQISNH
nr:PEP-CTERM sorting domain-containing protein [uncultured Desulfobacter sp.]